MSTNLRSHIKDQFPGATTVCQTDSLPPAEWIYDVWRFDSKASDSGELGYIERRICCSRVFFAESYFH